MKVLLINNRFPTKKKPHIATFIKSIFESIKASDNNVDLLISRRNKLKGVAKLFDSFLFYLQIIFFRNYKNYDVLYINRFNHFGFILSTKIQKNQEVIIHWHGSELRSMNLSHKFSLRFIKTRYFHIVPSLYYKNLLISKLCINKGNIFISPSGGVDFSLFNTGKGACSDTQEVVLGFASGAKKEKGLDLVLQLIKDLNDLEEQTEKTISFEIIEYGDEIGKLKETEELINITLLQPLEKNKMPEFYNNCDILLFPTHEESLGLVGLEAMACNIPVVGTNCTALPEYIISGKTGELFDKGNYNSFKNAVIQVITNIQEYSPREFISHYSKDEVVEGYRRIFKEINTK
ncbi:MAG TPA: glycosyltransferase [Flavobacteriales bacterium]|nr:glycosyltransferase [Flavobacteriales bacterium]